MFYNIRRIRTIINPITLRMAKTLWSFGHSECNRVKYSSFLEPRPLCSESVWRAYKYTFMHVEVLLNAHPPTLILAFSAFYPQFIFPDCCCGWFAQCRKLKLDFCFDNTLMCLSIGTPKNNKFSICSKWKIHYF